MIAKPPIKTVTIRCKSKKRFAVTFDVSFLELMQAVGSRLNAKPRMKNAESGVLVDVFVIQESKILELYRRDGGVLVGYVFVNLDVWMSYLDAIDQD